MGGMLQEILSLPTAVYTVLFTVVMVYWLFVVLGAFDIDTLGSGHTAGHALDGVAKGAIEGVAKGAIEGVAKGAIEGVAKGAIEGVAKGTGPSEVGAAGFFAMRFRSVPATVVLSVLVTFAFLFSTLLMRTLRAPWSSIGLPSWLLSVLVFIGAPVLGLPLTMLVVRPFGDLFRVRIATGHKDLVGKICVVSTGYVDGGFGQAIVEDGGAGLVLQVRCDTAGVLRRGDRALIIGWDDKRQGFTVEPLDAVLEHAEAERRRASVKH